MWPWGSLSSLCELELWKKWSLSRETILWWTIYMEQMMDQIITNVVYVVMLSEPWALVGERTRHRKNLWPRPLKQNIMSLLRLKSNLVPCVQLNMMVILTLQKLLYFRRAAVFFLYIKMAWFHVTLHRTFTNSSQKSNGTVAFKSTSNFCAGGSVFAGTWGAIVPI